MKTFYIEYSKKDSWSVMIRGVLLIKVCSVLKVKSVKLITEWVLFLVVVIAQYTLYMKYKAFKSAQYTKPNVYIQEG